MVPTGSNFNPRTPCGVRPSAWWAKVKPGLISIHAPLAGCDVTERPISARHCDFNPRTPCGVRRSGELGITLTSTFQSTHPLRGATGRNRAYGQVRWHFNPRTPCGVRLHTGARGLQAQNFNPRTPCGVRRSKCGGMLPHKGFQSTHPLRGATPLRWRYRPSAPYFNPRTPCGVRPAESWALRSPRHFNPRTPCGVRQQKRTKKTALFLN